jgi:hypothetical protein
MIRRLTIALVVLYAAQSAMALDEQDPRIWLEPCNATMTNSVDDLERAKRLREALELDEWPFARAGNSTAQLLVQPAFEPEWVVRVFHPKDGACSVFATVADRNVYYANQKTTSDGSTVLAPRPAKIKATTLRSDLSCDLADQLGDAWMYLLRHIREKEPTDPMVLDGVSYTAVKFEVFVGDRCGQTHSPPDGSPAAKMVAIANRLQKLATTSDHTLETEIARHIEDLLSSANGDRLAN